MFEVIQWLLTYCCSNTPTLYFKTMFSPKYQLRFYSKRLLCYVKVRRGMVGGFQIGLAILQSSVFSDEWLWTWWASLCVFVCSCRTRECWLLYLCSGSDAVFAIFMCFSLQGCSWSVIFVDLDAHNRNRQTLCSLLPRESRSHVSPFICATTKICLQMTAGSLPLDHMWQLGQWLYTLKPRLYLPS